MSWQRHSSSRAFAPAPAENAVVMAISNNDRRHLANLLASGADPDAPHRDTCPMVFAAHRGELEVIDLLLAHKGNINQKDAKGMTALMVAATYQMHGLADALICRGAALDAQDNEGHTALLHAVFKKDHNAVALLVRAGAKTDLKNKTGKTVADYLGQPENAGLKATFEAALKDAAKINVAATSRVLLRKPLQIRAK